MPRTIDGDQAMCVTPGFNLVTVDAVVGKDRRPEDDRLTLCTFVPSITYSERSDTGRYAQCWGHQFRFHATTFQMNPSSVVFGGIAVRVSSLTASLWVNKRA
jgi:hypothetical protein